MGYGSLVVIGDGFIGAYEDRMSARIEYGRGPLVSIDLLGEYPTVTSLRDERHPDALMVTAAVVAECIDSSVQVDALGVEAARSELVASVCRHIGSVAAATGWSPNDIVALLNCPRPEPEAWKRADLRLLRRSVDIVALIDEQAVALKSANLRRPRWPQDAAAEAAAR